MYKLREEEKKVNTLYEDESLLVIDKPSGWIVTDAATAKDQQTVQSWIAANLKFQISNLKLYRSGIVHRLDKETSGCLIIAKTKLAFENLQNEFKSRLVNKEYTALVHGKVEAQTGEIKAEVGRLPWRRDRFGVLAGGRDSETGYSVVSRFINSKTGQHFTLLKLKPKTGRTHQIRIHMKFIGHPIVGDPFYAGRKTSRNDRKWCPRLFLHAAKISFHHPVSKKTVEVEDALPEDLAGVIANLELQK